MLLPKRLKLLYFFTGLLVGFTIVKIIPQLVHAADYLWGSDAAGNFVIQSKVGGVITPTPIFFMSPAGVMSSSQMSAAQISSGTFGANTGGGTYAFSGNVGIGTTGPGGRLEIVGGQLVLPNGDFGTPAGFVFRNASGALDGGLYEANNNVFYYQMGDGDKISFKNNAGTVVSSIENDGGILLKAGGYLRPQDTDSTTALQIKTYTGSTAFVNFDTTNQRVGIGTTGPAAALDVVGQIVNKRVPLTDGAAISVNWANGNTQSVVLGGNRTLNFSGGVDGGKYVLILTQDATGSRTITNWSVGGTVRWSGGTAPTLTTTANKADWFGFIYNGTTYDGVANIKNF